ncbi:MAG: hypothetical protein IJM01_06235 [Eubacterium sp.]|nr:hypothetical protein [Eubacterium sp.]
MENMGFLFEFCDKYCREIYETKINKKTLLTAFMNSRFGEEMEEGHPKFLSQAAKDSLRQWIDVDYDSDLSGFEGTEAENKYVDHQFYWVGWIYAYIHFRSKKSSKKIISVLPIDEMLEQYHLCHEMDRSIYYSRIADRIENVSF